MCATSLGLQVLCDGCDKGFHWWCVKLESLPEEEHWYCSGCPATDASIPAEQAPQPTAAAAVQASASEQPSAEQPEPTLSEEAVGAVKQQPTPSGKARCEGRNPAGEQCKRSLSAGAVLCWQHLQQQSTPSASVQPSAPPSAPQPEQPEPTASKAEEPAPQPTAAAAVEASASGQPSAPPAEAEQPIPPPPPAEGAVDASKQQRCAGHGYREEPCKHWALPGEVFCRKDLELFNAKAARWPSSPPTQAAQPAPTVSRTEQAAPQPTAAAAVEAVGASTQPTPSGKARCEGLSAKGEHCKRTPSTGEVLCWHHLKQSKASASGQPSARPSQLVPASEAEDDSGGEAAIGRRLEVLWPDERQYYKGTVRGYQASCNKHRVVYDDGDKQLVNLSVEIFQWLDQEEEEEAAAQRDGRNGTRDPGKRKRTGGQEASPDPEAEEKQEATECEVCHASDGAADMVSAQPCLGS